MSSKSSPIFDLNQSVGSLAALKLVREKASWLILLFTTSSERGTRLLRVLLRWWESCRSCELLCWLGLLLTKIVGPHTSKALFQVNKLSGRSHMCALGTSTSRHKVWKFVRIHVGEIVKITIFLGHSSKLAGLDGCFCGRLGEELGVDIADVWYSLGIRHKRWLNLLHVHLIPVDRSEVSMLLQLSYSGLTAADSFLRLFKFQFEGFVSHEVMQGHDSKHLRSSLRFVWAGLWPRRIAFWEWESLC